MRFLAPFPVYLGRLLAAIAAITLVAQPVAAQSILRDAETEALLNDMAAPLIEAAGLEPNNVDMVLINNRSINAFVAGGQAIYIHSGLIEAADTANEVQGVIAHELGHITGGHINRMRDGIGTATNISLLSMLVGVAAALAGAGEAGMGIIAAGQQAAVGKFLAFTRVQEASADAAGAEYLSAAGISGRGSLEFFKKLQNLEFRYGRSQADEAEFSRTHPLSGDRIARLRETYIVDPAWDNPDDPELQTRFVRVKAKLYGYQAEPARTLQKFPETRQDVPARYARAYAYHKNALIEEALEEADGLLAVDSEDPYFLELKGQVLLESGRPDEAIEPLRKAARLTRNEPLIASMFGHALIATEDKENFAEAEQVLRAAVSRDRYNPFAWYQLGVVYAANGDMPRARLASAEQQVMSRQYGLAIRSAQFAEAELPVGSPDWIRAQDIGLQARAELERLQDRR
ncbi:M48 family metalloprotease [Pontixanthobacter aestiaquae]|uniref:M48 family metalloprotease n=1 Tax=Pontixanthobacter aestiaquae TaxID=1509367 RepID=A0A844Z4J4_9SPHN|nr:M48 family metalloprotease [Pontixanthobacter aestiaquae]MDN3646822.1 M48 family metalloprotease [Pontixanthobacter aestiaquae]MXO82196.1 M48 family metalloprotease [Pontixanthobacter aestiaquae]